jgi:hypothetical protein
MPLLESIHCEIHLLELEDLVSFIQECETITLSSQSPATKTSTLSAIVDCFLSGEKQVQYLDLDLQFSSMVTNNPNDVQRSSELLQIFWSRDIQTVDLIISLLDSSNVKKGGIIIVDSIGSLQSLLLQQGERRIDFVKSNHRAAVLLTLIEEFACRNSKALILANITRPRPRNGKNVRSWDIELSGGRMIKLKSNVVISATEIAKDPITKEPNIRLDVESVRKGFNQRFREGETFALSLKSFI